MEWNFFLSYHGHNGCDTGFSHIKRAIKSWSGNNQREVRGNQDVVQIINGIRHHSAYVLDIVEFNTQVATLNDFRQFHRFSFPGSRRIRGSFFSDSPHEKEYEISREEYRKLRREIEQNFPF